MAVVFLFMMLLIGTGCGQSAAPVSTTEQDETADTEELADGEVELNPANPDLVEDATPLQVGDKAPDFEVEAMGGETLKLSDYFGKSDQPVVLLFNRASW